MTLPGVNEPASDPRARRLVVAPGRLLGCEEAVVVRLLRRMWPVCGPDASGSRRRPCGPAAGAPSIRATGLRAWSAPPALAPPSVTLDRPDALSRVGRRRGGGRNHDRPRAADAPVETVTFHLGGTAVGVALIPALHRTAGHHPAGRRRAHRQGRGRGRRRPHREHLGGDDGGHRIRWPVPVARRRMRCPGGAGPHPTVRPRARDCFPVGPTQRRDRPGPYNDREPLTASGIPSSRAKACRSAHGRGHWGSPRKGNGLG